MVVECWGSAVWMGQQGIVVAPVLALVLILLVGWSLWWHGDISPFV